MKLLLIKSNSFLFPESYLHSLFFWLFVFPSNWIPSNPTLIDQLTQFKFHFFSWYLKYVVILFLLGLSGCNSHEQDFAFPFANGFHLQCLVFQGWQRIPSRFFSLNWIDIGSRVALPLSSSCLCWEKILHGFFVSPHVF